MRRPCEVSRFCGHPCYAKSNIGVRPRGVTKPCARCGMLMTDSITQIGKYCSKKCCDDDKRIDPAIRFWKYAIDEGAAPCWIWRGGIGTDGYGKFYVNGRTVHAHRFAYEMIHGAISRDDDRVVCHRCDNPKCVNPAHLFIGTISDNTQDMISKGRHPHGESHWTRRKPELIPRGAQHWTARNSA